MATLFSRILFRAGTSTTWNEHNIVLSKGEPGYETDTRKIKVGDGTTPYNDLPYLSGSYTLPIASATTLGGVQPETKTTAMTQTVGVDETGKLWTVPSTGGGGGLSVAQVEYQNGDVVNTILGQIQALSSNIVSIKWDKFMEGNIKLTTADGEINFFPNTFFIDKSNRIAIDGMMMSADTIEHAIFYPFIDALIVYNKPIAEAQIIAQSAVFNGTGTLVTYYQ